MARKPKVKRATMDASLAKLARVWGARIVRVYPVAFVAACVGSMLRILGT